MADEQDWNAIAASIDETGIPAAENAPPQAPTPGLLGDKVAPYGAVDVLRQSLGVDETAPTEAPQGREVTLEEPDWNAVAGSMEGFQLPGYLQTMNQGLQRGVSHVEAAVPTLKGVGAELVGDEEAAAGYAAEATKIEKAQPAPVVSDVLDIQSKEDFLYWASERLGEQAPNMALMAAGGGIGGVLAKLVGRGIISAERAATLGAAIPNIGLETAGTAQEQRAATGRYNPVTSIVSGVGKGILETYGPVKFIKEIKGASVLGAAGRAAVREGLLTEPWQEAIDIGARKLNDPNYSFFNEDMTWLSSDVSTRLAESAATGFLVGGGYAAPLQAGANVLDKVLPGKPETPPPGGGKVKDTGQFPAQPAPSIEDDTTAPEPPPDQPLEPGPLSWLREMQIKKQLELPYDPTPATEPVLDISETSTIESGMKTAWQMKLEQERNTEQVLNIEDDNLPRYAPIGQDGKLGKKIFTDTDLEEDTARQGPLYANKAGLLEVQMKSLQPAFITAEVWDLPPPEDNRIWFLPGTTMEEKTALLAQYEQINQQIEALKPERFTQGLNALEQAEALYEPMLNSGLRVIPSRGTSFYYTGTLEGTAITERPKSRRGVQAYTGPQDLKAGAKLYPPEAPPSALNEESVQPYQKALALDFNKIRDEDFSVDADGVLTLHKDIDPSAVTYGYGTVPVIHDAVPDSYTNDSAIKNDPAAPLEVRLLASTAINWWKTYVPYLRSVSKKLGVAMPSLVVSESPEVSPIPTSDMSYDPNYNIIVYNPYKGNGDLVGADTEIGFLLSILHEFGHAATLQTWAKLPPRVQGLVIEGWHRAVLTTRITGSTAHVQLPMLPEGAPPKHRYYYLSFIEYIAEQARRWNSADATAMSPQEKFFKNVGRKLTGMYNGFVEKLGEEEAFKLFIPDYSFNTWYDYLADAQEPNNPATGAPGAGLHKMIRNSRMLNMDIKLPKDLQVTYLQVLEAVQNFGHLIPASTTLRLVDYGPDTKAQLAEDSEYLSMEYGSFDNQKNVLTMILGALAYNAYDDPLAANKLLVHEAYHSIQKYLEPGEFRILAREARLNKTMNHQEIGNYWRYYRDNLREAGVDPDTPMMIALVKELVEHEAIARLVELRLDGKDFGNETNTILDKIIELFQRIINLVRGNGFQSVKDVETAFFKGEFAERRNQEEMLEELEQMDLYGEDKSLGMIRDRIISKYKEKTRPEDTTQGEAWRNINEAERDIYTPGVNRETGTFTKGERAGMPAGPFSKINAPADKFTREMGAQYREGNIATFKPGPLRVQEGDFVLGAENQNEATDYDHATAARDARAVRLATAKATTDLRLVDKSMQVLRKRQPFRIEQVEPGLEVRIFERAEDVSLGPDQHVSVPTQGREGYRTYAFISNGQPAGYIMTHLEPGIGWDVDMIDIAKRSLGGITLVKKMVAFMSKDVGQTLQASGFLTPMGYTMLKMTAPEQVMFHVQDVNSGMWYSPRQIQLQIDAAKRVGNKAKETWYKALLAKVPKAFFTDAAASTMFSKKAANRKGSERDAQRAQQQAEDELLAAMDQGRMPVDPFLAAYGAKKGTTEPEHYGMSNVMNWLRNEPTGSPNAGIVLQKADKIMWASKLWYSIQQLTYRNPHIPTLRAYTYLMQLFNTRRMEWTSRADQTLKYFWDIDGLTNAQKDAVGSLMFWATEMEYLTPGERALGVVRHPSAMELAQEMQRLGFNQAAYDAYKQITKDFDDFLTAMETVTAQNIRRDLANQPQAMQKAITELAADMVEMRKKPYFPLTRFGEYYITVRNQFVAGKAPVVWFSCYATERERNAAFKEVQRLHPAMDITYGKVPENVHEFMGLPATLLRSIKAKLPGITQTQKDWIDQFQAIMAPERSFRKRFLKRKGTPGYSYDAMRVYASYFRSGANYLARIEYKDQLEAQIEATNRTSTAMWDRGSKRSQIVTYMRKHLDYVMTGGSDWSTFKAIVSVFQLGFSVAAAGMNVLQIPTITWPHLSHIFGSVRASRELSRMMKATKFTFGKPPPGMSQQFLDARDEMIRQGKIDIGQAPELAGYAEGANLLKLTAGNKKQRAWRAFSYYSMWMFQHSEQYGRELTFIAAYNLAMKDPTNKYITNVQVDNLDEIQDLVARLGLSFQEATATVVGRLALDGTMFNYAPYARPKFLQSGPMSSILVFMQYPQNMIFFLMNNPGKYRALVMLMVLYGIAGLPGADDLDKVIKALSRRLFEKDFSPLEWTRDFMNDILDGTMFDEVGADVLLHGISRYGFGTSFLPEGYGAPQFDASANGSMGNIIPGLAPAATEWGRHGTWDKMTAQVLSDVAGAGFGQMFAWMKFMDAGGPFTTDVKKWEMVNFRFAKAFSKAGRYAYQGGDINPDTGQTFVKFNMQDPDDVATIVAQLAGFTPRKISEKWERIRMAKDLEAWYAYRQKTIMTQMDVARRAGDKDAVKDVYAARDKYNAEVIKIGIPELVIKGSTISTSMKGRARARMLRDQERGLTKKQEGINRYVKERFPKNDYEGEVETKVVK